MVFFLFYTKWVELSVQWQGGITGLEVSGDTVCFQQVIQDLWDDGKVKMWVGTAGGANGLGREVVLTMSGVVPIFLASSLRSIVLR